ncbi:MAG: restriction endonuclease subunit S [Thiobacillaceae bacterium]
MAVEWQPMPFERLLTEPVRNGIYKPKEFHGRGAKIVNMGELFAHPRLRAVPMKRVELSDSERQWLTLSKGDLIFARRSLVAEGAGKCSIVLDLDEPTTFESSIIRARPDSTKADPLYLYYFFSSSLGLHRLDTIRRHVAVAGITGSDLAQLEIPVPPLSEQRAIAHILGTLDDKIELNRRMNETLEAMARALFKSWFVDFDPVRAKQVGWVSPSGRNPPIAVNGGLRGDAANPPYDLPPHILDLFPDSLEDSELGEIPKGWQIKSISDLTDVVGGTTPSTKEQSFWEGGTHAWATPKDLSALSVPILLDTERRITEAGLSQIGSGLLPKGTVLLSSRAPIGYLVVTEIPVGINQGFIAMLPKTGTSNLFLLLWASAAHEEIVSRANGSTFLEISKANFRPIPVVAPPTDVMRKFDRLARPLYERIIECARESRTLAALRDTLLPKLISGELRVQAAERLMEEASA